MYGHSCEKAQVHGPAQQSSKPLWCSWVLQALPTRQPIIHEPYWEELGRAEGLSCVTPLIPALASHHRFRQTQSSLRDAKHLCPYKLTSRRSLNGFASGAASPAPKAPTQPGRNFSVRWAKIPQLPPNSKRLLAKKSGLTFHFFCSAIQRHRQHSTTIGVCTTSVRKQCGKISLGALK